VFIPANCRKGILGGLAGNKHSVQADWFVQLSGEIKKPAIKLQFGHGCFSCQFVIHPY
jgi:hypothetical protein